MATDLKAMNVEELEDYRVNIAEKMGGLKAEFRRAGAEKAKKIAASPKAIAQAKINEGRAELAALATEGSAEAVEVDNG